MTTFVTDQSIFRAIVGISTYSQPIQPHYGLKDLNLSSLLSPLVLE